MLCNIIHTAAALLALAAFTVPASAQTVYSTDFTDLSGWTTFTNLAGYEWQADATPGSGACTAPPFRSAPACLNFNDGVTFGPNTQGLWGHATSPVITLDPAMPVARVTFWYSVDQELGCFLDYTSLEVLDAASGASLATLCVPDPREQFVYDCRWAQAKLWLDPRWGAIQLRFHAGALDQFQNGGRGPFIDDLVVEYACDADAEFVCYGTASSAYPHVQGVTLGGSRLAADGSPSLSAGVLGVSAQRIEGPGFALLLASPGPSTLIVTGGTYLCLPPSSITRLGLATVSGATDSAIWRIPVGTPASPLPTLAVGDSLLLQGWYRDGGTGTFTDALRVHFCQ